MNEINVKFCESCKSTMLVAKKTKRWTLYKCSRCTSLIGEVAKHVKRRDRDKATKEMDAYAESILCTYDAKIIDSLRNMDSDERETWLRALFRQGQE